MKILGMDLEEFMKLCEKDIEDQIDMELIAQSEKEIAEHGTISLEEWEKRINKRKEKI
jgi:hypothetical protein